MYDHILDQLKDTKSLIISDLVGDLDANIRVKLAIDKVMHKGGRSVSVVINKGRTRLTWSLIHAYAQSGMVVMASPLMLSPNKTVLIIYWGHIK